MWTGREERDNSILFLKKSVAPKREFNILLGIPIAWIFGSSLLNVRNYNEAMRSRNHGITIVLIVTLISCDQKK